MCGNVFHSWVSKRSVFQTALTDSEEICIQYIDNYGMSPADDNNDKSNQELNALFLISKFYVKSQQNKDEVP
jgi:hypothetical protein